MKNKLPTRGPFAARSWPAPSPLEARTHPSPLSTRTQAAGRAGLIFQKSGPEFLKMPVGLRPGRAGPPKFPGLLIGMG